MSVLKPGTTLMEASAGTGKTFKISHKVLRLVAEEGIAIERLLVVTFTEAATSELKDRVRLRLRDGLQGLLARAEDSDWTPPDAHLETFVDDADVTLYSKRLQRALVDFDQAPISTIHGFCSRMLRRHAFESGAAFDAELVADVKPLVTRLVTDHYLREVHDAPDSFLAAFAAAGLQTHHLEDLATKVLDPDIEVLPEHIPADQPDLTEWLASIADLRPIWATDEPTLFAKFSDRDVFYGSASKSHTSYPERARLPKLIREFGKWLDNPGLLGGLPAYMELFTDDHLKSATVDGAHPTTPAFFAPLAACLALREQVGAELSAWVLSVKHDLIHTVRTWIPRWVRGENKRTYNDLLRDLKNALAHPEKGPTLRASIQEHYEAALIDEFQDTDPVQWAIFRELFPTRLCLIGDPKQAIYGFRGADVHTYLDAAATAAHREPLPTNFRTDGLLIDAVNHLYQRLKRPFGADKPLYEAVQAHFKPRRIVGDDRPPFQIRFLPREGARTNRETIEAWFLNQELPTLVANDIAAELALGLKIEHSDGTAHPITPRDCAILTRTNKQARQMQDALLDKGIPSVRRGTDSVFDSEVVGDLVRVLEGIGAPTDRSAVSSALTSSLMGRTADNFREFERDDQKWSEAVASFRNWHALWVDMGFVRMFTAWLDDDDVVARLLRAGSGDRAVTDLLHLGEILHDAAIAGPLGPAGLIGWLRAKGPTADHDEAAIRLESDADAVKIYTVHSAKGLEFPLVWCPYLWSGAFLWPPDRMHTRFYCHQDHRWKLDIGSPEHEAHQALCVDEIVAESLRLTYVALTRARHRCTVYWGVGGGRNSALAYLFHSNPDADDIAESAWKRVGRDDLILLDLEDLSNEPGIGYDIVDWKAPRDAAKWEPDPLRGRKLGVRTIERQRALDTWWRRSSFTDLSRHSDEAAGADPLPARDIDDEKEDEEAEVLPVLVGQPIVLHELWGGAQVGTMIHTIMEIHDFQNPDALEALVREQLVAHGFDGDKWTDAVRENLQEVIETPLDPGGFCLADIPKAKRLDELEFTFPVVGGFAAKGQVSVKDLAEAFESDLGPGAPAGTAARLRKLRFLPVRGFMRGYVDLIFEHGGLWYVVDWKSNKLGTEHTHYAESQLGHTMLKSVFVLQYHLYVLALHRYLGWRLGPAYDYDTHMGGAYYLFTRGMSKRWGPGFGIYRDRPTKALIERLDALMRGGA